MLRIALTLFGAIHLVVVIWHRATHRELAVALSPAQNFSCMQSACLLHLLRWACCGHDI